MTTAVARSAYYDVGPQPVSAPAATTTVVNPLVRATWYLFVFSIPFELPHVTLPLEVPTAAGMLFIASTILHTGACYRRVPGALICFTLYLWFMGISALVNNVEHTLNALTLTEWLLQLLMLFWAASNLLRRDEVFRGTLMALSLACAARAAVQIFGLATTITPVWGGGERISAFHQNPNLAAMILSTGLVCALSLRTTPNRGRLWRLVVCWIPAVLAGAAIVQTGSRGGVVCGVAGLLGLLIAGRAKLGTIFVGFLTVIALVFGIARSETMRRRFLSAEEGNLAGRERIYPAAIDMFKEKPLLGWGPADNQFELARRLDERKRPSRDMHNLILELVTAAGVVGAIPFLIGLGLCVGAAWAARGGPRGALPIALFAALGPGILSGTWIASKILWLAFAVATASGRAGQRYVAVLPEDT